MIQATTFLRLQKIIASFAERQLCDIKLSTHFEDDLNFDSLDMVELIIAIEDEFKLAYVSDEARNRVTTVEDAVIFIENAEKGDEANV